MDCIACCFHFSHTKFPSIQAIQKKSTFPTRFLIFSVRWHSAFKNIYLTLAEKKRCCVSKRRARSWVQSPLLRCQDKTSLLPPLSPLNNVRGEMGARKTSSVRKVRVLWKEAISSPQLPLLRIEDVSSLNPREGSPTRILRILNVRIW